MPLVLEVTSVFALDSFNGEVGDIASEVSEFGELCIDILRGVTGEKGETGAEREDGRDRKVDWLGLA